MAETKRMTADQVVSYELAEEGAATLRFGRRGRIAAIALIERLEAANRGERRTTR